MKTIRKICTITCLMASMQLSYGQKVQKTDLKILTDSSITYRYLDNADSLFSGKVTIMYNTLGHDSSYFDIRYDELNKKWKIYDSVATYYDSQILDTLKIEKDFNGIKSKYRKQYDNKGKLVNLEHYIWNTKDLFWFGNDRTTFSIDSISGDSLQSQYAWDWSKMNWYLNLENKRVLESNGLVNKQFGFIVDASTGNRTLKNKWIYSKDTFNNDTLLSYFMPQKENFLDWNNLYKKKQWYDTKGHLIEIEESIHSIEYDYWHFSHRTQYIYSGDTLKSVINIEPTDTLGITSKITDKTDYIYNSNGVKLFDVIYTTDNQKNLVLYSKTTYYNSLHSVVSLIDSPKTTEIESINNQSIKCSPNPARDYITIKLNDALTADVEIISSTGSIVFKDKINDGTSISVASFTSGIYFLKVTTTTETKVFDILKQ